MSYAKQDRVARQRLGVGRRPQMSAVETSGRLSGALMREGDLQRGSRDGIFVSSVSDGSLRKCGNS